MKEMERHPLQSAHVDAQTIADAISQIYPKPFSTVDVADFGIGLSFSRPGGLLEKPFFVITQAHPPHPTRRYAYLSVDEPNYPQRKRKGTYFVGIRIGDGPEYFVGNSKYYGHYSAWNEQQEMGNALLVDRDSAEELGMEITVYEGEIDNWLHHIRIRNTDVGRRRKS